jgi:Family of unknown function (DUF6228)
VPIDEDGWLVLPSSDNQGSLRLSPLEPHGRCVAEMERAGKLQARHHLWDMHAGLARFLGELAEDWRGWDGIRTWAPDEPGLKVRCAHDGLGHVTCVVTLTSPYEHWSAIVRVMLDAGALEDLARDARRWESARVPGTGE